MGAGPRLEEQTMTSKKIQPAASVATPADETVVALAPISSKGAAPANRAASGLGKMLAEAGIEIPIEAAAFVVEPFPGKVAEQLTEAGIAAAHERLAATVREIEANEATIEQLRLKIAAKGAEAEASKAAEIKARADLNCFRAMYELALATVEMGNKPEHPPELLAERISAGEKALAVASNGASNSAGTMAGLRRLLDDAAARRPVQLERLRAVLSVLTIANSQDIHAALDELVAWMAGTLGPMAAVSRALMVRSRYARHHTVFEFLTSPEFSRGMGASPTARLGYGFVLEQAFGAAQPPAELVDACRVFSTLESRIDREAEAAAEARRAEREAEANARRAAGDAPSTLQRSTVIPLSIPNAGDVWGAREAAFGRGSKAG